MYTNYEVMLLKTPQIFRTFIHHHSIQTHSPHHVTFTLMTHSEEVESHNSIGKASRIITMYNNIPSTSNYEH